MLLQGAKRPDLVQTSRGMAEGDRGEDPLQGGGR
jgi:hypothetical protein